MNAERAQAAALIAKFKQEAMDSYDGKVIAGSDPDMALSAWITGWLAAIVEIRMDFTEATHDELLDEAATMVQVATVGMRSKNYFNEKAN